MRALIEPLNQYDEYRKIREDLENRSYPIQISGCTDSQKSHLIYALGQGAGCRLILTYREEKARELGFRRTILQTRPIMKDAVALYLKRGLFFHRHQTIVIH